MAPAHGTAWDELLEMSDKAGLPVPVLEPNNWAGWKIKIGDASMTQADIGMVMFLARAYVTGYADGAGVRLDYTGE